MARAVVLFFVSGALLLTDGAASFADDCGSGYGGRGFRGRGRGGSSPFAIDRGVSQGGRIRFRTSGCGGARGSSPFAIQRGVFQGGRVRFRSAGGGCGCGYGRTFATGSSWSVLRNHLARSDGVLRYAHRPHYFYRRYAYIYVKGTPADGEEITPDHYLHPGYDVAAHPLTKNQELHLGVWKLYRAEYQGARVSFDKVLAVHPKHKEASWGRALSSVLSRDWKQASQHLAQVAELGELNLDDDLLTEQTFGEIGAIERVMQDVRVATRYGHGSGDAHLVAAWLHASQGNARLARIHVKKAQGLGFENAAVRALASHFEEEKPASEAAPTPSSGENGQPKAAAVADVRGARAPVLVASR